MYFCMGNIIIILFIMYYILLLNITYFQNYLRKREDKMYEVYEENMIL